MTDYRCSDCGAVFKDVDGGDKLFCDRRNTYVLKVPACAVALLVTSITEQIDHPAHYGGADNPYEAIKVIEAWALGFNLGNTVKYIARAGKKGDTIECLKKARWYLDREILNLELVSSKK